MGREVRWEEETQVRLCRSPSAWQPWPEPLGRDRAPRWTLQSFLP